MGKCARVCPVGPCCCGYGGVGWVNTQAAADPTDSCNNKAPHRITYQGECGTCESELNGKKIRLCKAIVPRGMRKNECTIKVLK